MPKQDTTREADEMGGSSTFDDGSNTNLLGSQLLETILLGVVVGGLVNEVIVIGGEVGSKVLIEGVTAGTKKGELGVVVGCLVAELLVIDGSVGSRVLFDGATVGLKEGEVGDGSKVPSDGGSVGGGVG